MAAVHGGSSSNVAVFEDEMVMNAVSSSSVAVFEDEMGPAEGSATGLTSLIPGLTRNLPNSWLAPESPEPPVAKTASYALHRNICPIAKWGILHPEAHNADSATLIS